MAKSVLEGAKTIQEVEADLEYHVAAEAFSSFDAIVVGVPTYYHDMTIDLKNIFEEAATKNVNLKGKIGAAFGSYGWSGEAPRLALEIMKNKFEMQIIEPPLLVKYTPDQSSLEDCREFGRKIAERLMHKT
jgi:flavorubredoxin